MSNRKRIRQTGSRQKARAGRDVYAAAHDQTVINNYNAGREQPHAPGLIQKNSEPVVFGEIPKRPPAYQERESLHHEVAEADSLAVISTLTGARGMGKTQLAAAYARECIEAGWALVAWIGAERPDQVLAGLGQLAKALGLREDSDDSEAAAAKVRQWLERPRDERSLVVFDNATDPDSLTGWLPSAGSAQVLITSNRRSFDSLGTLIDVEVFTPDEAHAYLLERTSLQDLAGAGALSEEVGRLPLALAQAAGVIRAQRLSYADFLDRLHKISLDRYLKRQSGDDYPRGAAETVILALQQAEQDGKLARSVLLTLSVLSPDGVARDFLYAAGASGVFDSRPWLRKHNSGVTPVKIDATLEKLAETSLISFSLDGRTVIMHRFTQRVSRERDSSQRILGLVLFKAAQLIARQRNAAMPSWERPEEIDDLINQISSIWDNAQIRFGSDNSSLPRFHRRIRGQFEKLLINLRVWSVKQLTDTGNPRRAIQLGRSVASECDRVLGVDHPSTLTSRNYLANGYLYGGRIEEAIELHRQVLADRERVLGPDHPDTLTSRSNLITGFLFAGRAEEAIELLCQNLADRERVLGPNHPDALTTRSDLAAAHLNTGQVEKAIELDRRTLADRERILGPDHPNTMTSRNNLAAAYLRAGQVEDAIELHRRTLADRERVLGPDHPSTLISRGSLANAYVDAGQAEEAIELARQNLADQERVLGPDHPDTMTSRNNLANAYLLAGRPREAIELDRQNLADRERVLGPDHPNTMISRNNLANGYLRAGRVEEAIELHRQNLTDRERVLGRDHPDTVSSRDVLAAALKKGALSNRRPGERRPQQRH